jgi:hypothetical protein
VDGPICSPAVTHGGDHPPFLDRLLHQFGLVPSIRFGEEMIDGDLDSLGITQKTESV